MVKQSTSTDAAKERAPKCPGSGLEYKASDVKKAANGDRRVCPVCGGSIGLAVSKRSGAVTFGTHYRKGKTADLADRARKAKAGLPKSVIKGTPRAAANGTSKFVTGNGTEYRFVPAANAGDPSKAQGQVEVKDGKAGILRFDVFVTEDGQASFRNNRQGRTVKGKLA